MMKAKDPAAVEYYYRMFKRWAITWICLIAWWYIVDNRADVLFAQGYVLLFHRWRVPKHRKKDYWLRPLLKFRSNLKRVAYPVDMTVTGRIHEWKYDPKY